MMGQYGALGGSLTSASLLPQCDMGHTYGPPLRGAAAICGASKGGWGETDLEVWRLAGPPLPPSPPPPPPPLTCAEGLAMCARDHEREKKPCEKCAKKTKKKGAGQCTKAEVKAYEIKTCCQDDQCTENSKACYTSSGLCNSPACRLACA